MSLESQPHYNLTGPHFHPPPPTTRFRLYRTRTRTRGGAACCCLECIGDCGCCVLSCILQIICSIIFFIGLIILIVWLILRPHTLKFHTTNASLPQFSLHSSDSTLLYDLSLNFTVRNPNRYIGIYYDQIRLTAYYHDQNFSSVSLPPFFQGHKNTTDLGPVVFRGQTSLAVNSDLSSDYDSEKSDGLFHIDVKLKMKVRFKVAFLKTGSYKPKVECDLMIPLTGGSSNSSASGQSFQATKCHYDL